MTGKFDWETFQEIYDMGGFQVRADLTDRSAFLSLVALTYMQSEYLWQNYDDFDDVETAIDDAIAQIMDGPSNLDKVQVTNSGNQTIATATGTYLDFDTELYDPENMHDNVVNNSRIYAVNAGLHLITAGIKWAANDTGIRWLAVLRHRPSVPSSIYLGVDYIDNLGAASTPSCFLAVQDEAEDGDYYQLRVFQASGGNLDIVIADWSPRFAVVRL